MLDTDAGRTEILDDLFGKFHAEESEQNLLYHFIVEYRPDIVIDCINTATAIAYPGPLHLGTGSSGEPRGG